MKDYALQLILKNLDNFFQWSAEEIVKMLLQSAYNVHEGIQMCMLSCHSLRVPAQ